MVVFDTSIAIKKVIKIKIRVDYRRNDGRIPKNLRVQALHWRCYISKIKDFFTAYKFRKPKSSPY